MDDLTFAYRRDTGDAVRIPADWLEHPVLGLPFTATPPIDGAPLEARTVPALRELAADLGVDLTGLTRKPEIVDALASAIAEQTPAADTTTEQPSTPVGDDHPKEV